MYIYQFAYCFLGDNRAIKNHHPACLKRATDARLTAACSCEDSESWSPCVWCFHVSSTATEKWEQTATIQSAPAPCRGTGTPATGSGVMSYTHVCCQTRPNAGSTSTVTESYHSCRHYDLISFVLIIWRFVEMCLANKLTFAKMTITLLSFSPYSV